MAIRRFGLPARASMFRRFGMRLSNRRRDGGGPGSVNVAGARDGLLKGSSGKGKKGRGATTRSAAVRGAPGGRQRLDGAGAVSLGARLQGSERSEACWALGGRGRGRRRAGARVTMTTTEKKKKKKKKKRETVDVAKGAGGRQGGG